MKTRNFILSVIALCCMTMAQAQKTDVMTATLQHGDDVTVFTTQTAFANAYAAAVDGDVITLSPGIFNATNLTKSVNIYGSGFEENETDGTGISTINGSITIGVTNDTLSDIHIEGVKINGSITNNASSPLENIYFKKCYLNNISINSVITNVTFCNCVMGNINGVYYIKATNLLITNCYFGTITTFQPGSTVLIDHCIVTGCTSHFEGGNISSTHTLNVSQFTWKNSIFTYYANSYPQYYQRAGNGATLYNCIYVQSMGGYYSYYGNNLISVSGVSDVFSDATNANYSAERTFTLQQDEWIGEDNTEIGIRGGEYHWSRVPATPVVKSLQLNVDGTNLNVTFDAETR